MNMRYHVKYWLFSCLIALLILLCLELGARFIYYQTHAKYPLALQAGIVILKNTWSKAEAQRRIDQTVEELQELGLQANEDRGFAPKEIRVHLQKALYSEAGKTLLNTFRREYEEAFALFIREAEKSQTRVCVLYLPSDDYHNTPSYNREFFRGVAQKYQVDYLDCTEEFLKYPVKWITLLPENGHLSRFGNQVVAAKLSKYIDQHSNYRSPVTYEQRPEKFGDLSPRHDNKIWEVLPGMPFQVIVNSQGLRMEYDVSFPKQQQRILILGDSYTFGSYVPNYHCYPNLLDRQYADKEVINAGIGGYTIVDEASLFSERAKYVEPDITILQVLENDIEGLFYFFRNQHDRDNRVFTPSPEEIDLIKMVHSISQHE